MHTVDWSAYGGEYNGTIYWNGLESDSWEFVCLAHDDSSCPGGVGCLGAKFCSETYTLRGAYALLVNGETHVGIANCCDDLPSITNHWFNCGKYLIKIIKKLEINIIRFLEEITIA